MVGPKSVLNPQVGPRWPQEAPKMPQDAPKTDFEANLVDFFMISVGLWVDFLSLLALSLVPTPPKLVQLGINSWVARLPFRVTPT